MIKMLSKISLALVIIGAINWLLIGVFGYDLVAAIFGGQECIANPFVRLCLTFPLKGASFFCAV